jgi:hypothetical protein
MMVENASNANHLTEFQASPGYNQRIKMRSGNTPGRWHRNAWPVRRIAEVVCQGRLFHAIHRQWFKNNEAGIYEMPE